MYFQGLPYSTLAMMLIILTFSYGFSLVSDVMLP